MSNNNNDDTESNMPQPTMRDLFNLLNKCAQKEDIDDIKASIASANTETLDKIEHVNQRVDIIHAKTDANTAKISELEISIEVLKQDQLKNNMCISGIPTHLNKNNTAESVIAIAKALGLDYTPSLFTSYAVAGNKFVIVHFYNIKHKQTLMNKIRIKKSLMVEEALGVKSNSQIYLNDHLTPYFNALYLRARKAKSENKLVSASSYGGKIRARKRPDDIPTVITNELQLQMLIDGVDSNNMSQVSANSSNVSLEMQPSTSLGPKQRNNTTRMTKKHNKADDNKKSTRTQRNPMNNKRKLNNSNNNHEENLDKKQKNNTTVNK